MYSIKKAELLKPQKSLWKALNLRYDEKLHEAILQQHHASQFIALAGHYLIPQQPDDSNTNMQFIEDGNILLGKSIENGIRISLHLTDLKISILDQQNHPKKVIVLKGKTKQNAFSELKTSLEKLGIDVSSLNNKLHYEIPQHKLDEGSFFSITDKSLFQEITNYRHNADLVINEITASYKKAEPVRVWPHHFDTGSFIPVSYNFKGNLTQSIGLGWAIPDTMVEEPYYYLSIWSEKPTELSLKINSPGAGKWMMPDWKGAILKHSEILKSGSATEQHKLVKTFYNSGIKMIMDHFKQ